VTKTVWAMVIRPASGPFQLPGGRLGIAKKQSTYAEIKFGRELTNNMSERWTWWDFLGWVVCVIFELR
jgi:hypothetical protein